VSTNSFTSDVISILSSLLFFLSLLVNGSSSAGRVPLAVFTSLLLIPPTKSFCFFFFETFFPAHSRDFPPPPNTPGFTGCPGPCGPTLFFRVFLRSPRESCAFFLTSIRFLPPECSPRPRFSRGFCFPFDRFCVLAYDALSR